MLYEIRLKGRQKQGECSAILIMTFLIIAMSVFSLNLIPLVYASTVKPLVSDTLKAKAVTLAVSLLVLLTLRLVFSCLSFGCDRFMLKRAEDSVAGAGDIFYYFLPSRLISMCAFNLRLGAYKLLLLSVTALPFLLCGYLCCRLCEDGFSAAVCSIFAVFTAVFLLLGIGTYSKICDTLFLARYRYIKGDYLSFGNLISQSQQDMADKMSELRRLKVSFMGWFVLSLLIIPLPYVWCYYRQTKACFAVK